MRYLVFAYNTYYPEGGMTDCKFKTDDKDKAVKEATRLREEEWWSYLDIYDTQTGESISSYKEEYVGPVVSPPADSS